MAALLLVGWPGPSLGTEEITPPWLTVDADKQIVELRLVAASDGANGTMNFNGYGNGDLTVVIPLGWRVNVEFLNQGLGALPHSLVIINEVTPLPVEGGVPAFPRALTTRLVPGMEAGKGDAFSFIAAKEGRYLMFCGVTGHGVAGMWDYLVVSREAKVPRVLVKKPAAAAQTPKLLLGYDGHRWKAQSEEAKMALLSGFLIGAAFEQGMSVMGGSEPPAPEALEMLRRQGRIRFRFAPNVYKARLEDFYRYEDRLPMPVYRALFMINEQILRDAGGR